KLFDDLRKTILAIREKQDEFEKRGDPLLANSVRKMEANYNQLKDDINAVYKKVNRPYLAEGFETPSALESKANREFQSWFLERGIAAPFSVQGAGTHRKAYAEAFNKMMRRGDKALTPDEIKTLSVGSGPDGGFYVEPARSSQIITKLFETSEMRPIASVIDISTSSIKYPVDRDEPGFEWVSETGSAQPDEHAATRRARDPGA